LTGLVCRSEKNHAKNAERYLSPAEVCDLLKGIVVMGCWVATWKVDTSMMYHLVKSQSVIKLYIFYNMLEVGDRLFSAFGQDTIDALLWTATEPHPYETFRYIAASLVCHRLCVYPLINYIITIKHDQDRLRSQ